MIINSMDLKISHMYIYKHIREN
ncbi:hypothetical protein PBI_SCTP2_2 [Salicola phage SCTP-2]|nr:hypothetical protein PBI_SCTP2_2 [Salicola phage SCTP-2]